MSTISYIKLKPIKLKGGTFDLHFPHIKYNKTGQRLLLITDSLTREEVHTGKYFSGGAGQTISNAFDHAIKIGQQAPKDILIVTTRVYKKHESLTEQDQTDNSLKIYRRLYFLIQKFKPDTVLIAGFKEYNQFFRYTNLRLIDKYKVLNTVENRADLPKFQGRLLPARFGKYKCNIMPMFAANHVASTQPKHFANTVQLLGFYVYGFETAIRGHNLYNLSDETKVVIIKTVAEFDKFYQQLLKTKTPCIDTETTSLNRVYGNKLLTIQFSLDGVTAYLIPYHHAETPFLSAELKYITEKLKWYFEFGPKVVTIYQNAKFDILQLFAQLGIRYYNQKIWDVMVGTYFLEENRKFMRSTGLQGGYSLDMNACEHGSLGYYGTEIKKVDRANMARYSLQQIAEYGAFDVTLPFQICRMQLQEAKRRGSTYKGYFKAVTELSSDILYVFVEMEKSGILTDPPYISRLMAPNSELSQRLQASKDEFKTNEAAIKANQLILDKVGVPKDGQGIFGQKQEQWLLELSKPGHQKALFYDVLGLEPLALKKDGSGKLDKKFLENYAGIPEVDMLQKYRGLEKLKNTYVEGIFKKLMETEDGSIDYRLRASYTLVTILTTRSGASKPNLQALPSHGPLAKIIKRMFIASLDHIIIKVDFKVHEIRGWCNISKDYDIANSFNVGMQLNKQLRIMRALDLELDQDLYDWLLDNDWFNKKTEFKDKVKAAKRLGNRKELKAAVDILIELESKGDVHKINYQLFYSTPAEDVTPEQRQGVKQVAFGVVYEKGSSSLARDVFKKDIKPIDRKYVPKLLRLDPSSDEYEELLFEHRKAIKPYRDKAQDLIDTLFKKFKTGGDWIRATQAQAKKSLNAVNPLGPVRHLWGYMHIDTSAQATTNRRAVNSLIQGYSSNLGYTGAKIMLDTVWQLVQQKIDLGYKHGNMVHDSLSTECKIALLPLTLYYLEHSLTTQTHKRAREIYGFEMIVGLEIDMEIGGSEYRMKKWDFSTASLLKIAAEEIDWMQQELSYKLDKKHLMKCIKHNQSLVLPYRVRELQAQKDSMTPPEKILLTTNVAATLQWMV